MELHRPVLIDPEAPGRLHRVNVRAEEHEFPSVLLFLALHHGLHLVGGIHVAGVLHPVRGDHENRVLRNVLIPDVLVNIPDVMDRRSDGVDQRSAASHRILLLRHRLDLPDVHAVMKHTGGV